ncbi:TVP38/TMEM64 family protein [Candidatus Woesebacteria bacterium]|nr:TVP38/TMEM64 family protein [Candidatus Woesebacteria bacterium]
MKNKVIQLIKLLAIVVILYVALRYLLLPTVNSPEFRDFTQGLGVFGYVIIIGYVVLSHVFAPIAGTPGVALGVTIYGINTGMWLLYLAGLISASINFYIAKRFGRSWVIKLVGKDSMKKVDEFASMEGREALAISRLFGFALFDFISYAAGLTTLKYKEYILITALCALIPNLAMQYIFQDIDFQSEKGVMIWIGSIVLAGIAFGTLIQIYLMKRKRLTTFQTTGVLKGVHSGEGERCMF